MNEKLNIQDLIDTLAERHGMSKKNADSFVKEFFQLIEESLEKDKGRGSPQGRCPPRAGVLLQR